MDAKTPIGNIKMPNSNQQRSWKVDNQDQQWSSDETIEIPEDATMEAPVRVSPEEAQRMRDKFRAESEVNSQDISGLKERVEMLIGFGFSRSDINIVDNNTVMTFSLRTLRGYEQQEVTKFVEKNGKLYKDGKTLMSAENRHNFMLLCLSYGIEKIDGVDFDLILDCENESLDSKIQKRVDFLNSYDDVLISVVFEGFDELVKKHKEKYIPESPEEVKEAASQVGKSST